MSLNLAKSHVGLVFSLVLLVHSTACSSNSTRGETTVVESEQNEQPAVLTECVDFQKLIEKTYDFRPSKVTDAQRTAKSAEMDVVWEKVKADRQLVPCLVAALKRPDANKFFLFDGSTLLYGFDKSESSKKLVIQSYARADLGDIMLENWIAYPLQFGLEGMDTSAVGEAWLRAENPFYYLPQHGMRKIDKRAGAFAIYGSMDERFATPALFSVATSPDHPGREMAAQLLLKQITAEAIDALKKLDQTGLRPAMRTEINKFLSAPSFIEPRSGSAKITREQYLSAFEKLADGKAEEFMKLAVEVTDGEKDAVAVLRDEDIPLIRRARRFFASTGSPHVPEWYESFTDILKYLVLKPEIEQKKAA